VWRDQIRTRRFSLLTNKRWLWASRTHRRSGTVAFATSMLAYGTGILGWQALGARASLACCCCIALVAASTL